MFESTSRAIGGARATLAARAKFAALIILSLVAMTPAIVPAAAQMGDQSGEQSYEFGDGQSLTWDPDWELDEELTYVEDGLESVTLTQGVALFSVLSVPNDFDLNEARDIYLDSLIEEVGGATTIDRGDYGAVSYSLDLVAVEGFDFGIFTLFRAGSGDTPTFAYIFFSEIAAFSTQFASAQATFRLDDATIYDGVDGVGLQTQLEAVEGNAQDTSDPGNEESDAPTVEDPTQEPAEDQTDPVDGIGGLKGGDGDRQVATQDSDAAYTSPQFGVELDWGASWELDPDAEPPVSDTAGGIDSLSLVPVDGGGFLSVTFIDAGGTSVPDLVEVWESADFVADSAISADAEVVLADSSRDVGSMVLRDFLQDGTEIVVIREAAIVGDDTMAIVQLSAIPESSGTIVGAAQDDLTLAGEPVLAFFEIDDILQEFGQ